MKNAILKLISTLNLFPLFYGFTKNTATIFMLHRIAPMQMPNRKIHTELLYDYFNYLKKKKYHVISLNQYIGALINGDTTYKTIVFTVDDGYRDFYQYAYKVFRDFGYPATIFITSDFIENKLFFWWNAIEYILNTTARTDIELSIIGKEKASIETNGQKSAIANKITSYCKTISNQDKLELIQKLAESLGVDISDQPKEEYEPLRWEEIREMRQNGIDFYPHTKTHPILSKISMEEKVTEVTQPRRLIEEHLGGEADIFCYPNGQPEDFDEETISALRSANYKAAVVGYDGFNYTNANNDLFRIMRFGIPAELTLFKQYICGLEGFKRKILKM